MSNEPLFLRDIGASCDGKHVAASLNDGEITIWSTDSPEPVARCKPGFSGGESRYQIDPSRGLIYSGTWEDGLTCFDYKAKKVIWRRKDIIGIQTVNISTTLPNSLFLTLEAPDHVRWFQKAVSGVAELDAHTGKTRSVKPIGDWLWVHPEKPVLVTTNRGGGKNVIQFYDADQKELGIIAMSNFAVMDVAFSDDLIAVAEGKTGVRVMDYRCKLVSSYLPPGRHPNCITLAFSGGYLHVHDSWDGSYLLTLNPTSGELLSEYKRASGGDVCFINDGSSFVNVRGEVCRSRDGTVQFALKP